AWQAYGARSRHSDVDLADAVEQLVPPEGRPIWRAALAGYGEEQLARARGRVVAAIAKVEGALAGSAWLVGPACSLADVAIFSYFNYLPALCPDYVNASATPRVKVWLRAMAERPAVRSALARGRARDPFAVAIPAPEQIRWG
ncbi:MAG: glutathione S-transferase family protein, partial [Steroidobacteraceae bacterium]